MRTKTQHNSEFSLFRTFPKLLTDIEVCRGREVTQLISTPSSVHQNNTFLETTDEGPIDIHHPGISKSTRQTIADQPHCRAHKQACQLV